MAAGDEVDASTELGSNEGDEEGDAPPPKRFFSLPSGVCSRSGEVHYTRASNTPVNESSFTSPNAKASEIDTRPLSSSSKESLMTGSSAPRLVRFATASVTFEMSISRIF